MNGTAIMNYEEIVTWNMVAEWCVTACRDG
jgi:hypothetical protein